MSTTLKFDVVVNTGPRADFDFRVHRKGCRDLPLEKRQTGDHSYEIEGANVEAAIAADVEEYRNCEQGYERESYSVAPCAKAPRP